MTTESSRAGLHEAAPRFTPASALWTSLAAGLAMSIGILDLGCWALDFHVLRYFDLNTASMKPNTALALLAAGVALWSRRAPLPSATARWAARIGASLTLLIGMATLSEYLFSIDLGIDQLLFDVQGASPHPGRTPAMASWLLICIGAALLAIDVETPRGVRPAQWLALMVFAGATVAILGYLYDVRALYSVAPYASVAFLTALTLDLLAFGVLAARSDVGLMRRLTSDTAAGEFGRRLLPIIILLPTSLGWLQIYGEHHNWYATEFGTAMFATATAVLTAVLTWWTVGALWKREIARSRAQQALADSEQDLAITLRSIGDAVIATDLSGRITRMNGTAEALTGWFTHEAQGRKLDDVFNIVDERTGEPFLENPVTAVLRVGRAIELFGNMVLIARNDVERPIASRGAPIRTDTGELRGVVLVFRDLTDQRDQEIVRRSIERALRHSEARNSAILESAADAIIAMDSYGYIIGFNSAAERIFRIPRTQALGSKVADTIVPEHLRAAHEAGLARLLAGVAPAKLGRTIEMPALRGDGSEFPAEVVLSQIPDSEPPMFTAFVRDVTERNFANAERDRLTAELHQRVQEVEAANRELDSFAYIASHDLRSPLRDIASLATWIEEDSGPHLVGESGRHLKTLLSRVSRMDRLLSDLLEYSRVGRTTARIEEVRVAEVVTDALELVGSHEGFTVQIEGGEVPIETARTPLMHILRNLINNAIKHHHQGQGCIRVQVVADGGDYLNISVADDGPGIQPEYHETVFQPFKTLQSRDRKEGSGLGLAIVKKMVESVGGGVSIDSAPNRGTCIGFTWPIRWPDRNDDTVSHPALRAHDAA